MNDYEIAILNAVSLECERSEWRYCKSARVLGSAAESMEILDPDSQRRLFTEGETNTPRIEELYQVLIALVNDAKFVSGQGNFGRDPADPLFTECCLTPEGEAKTAWQNKIRKKAEQCVGKKL